MRVVHVITGLGQGGAEAMLEKLVLTGRRLDPQINHVVVNLGPPGIVGSRLAAAGIAVQSLCLRKGLALVPRVLALVPSLAPDPPVTIVQTWLWHADLLGGICARIAGNRRVVWNLRNSMPGEVGTKAGSRAVARACAWISGVVPQRIICNSRAALEAHAAIGYRRQRCTLIPNGFDMTVFRQSLDARRALRYAWRVRDEELLVGMVARVDPMKDHATFIRAAQLVAAAEPRARFLLTGTGVTGDAGIAALLADSGMAARFILEENRADVPSVMSALDVFCLASRSEGFPNALGEAMACAAASISTDVGDAADIIGDRSLVAPAGDAHALAACMERVTRLSAGERRTLALAQRERIAARFDIEQIWHQYAQLYRAL